MTTESHGGRYPANWREIAAEVRERSGNRCEGSPKSPGCRVAYDALHPVTGCRVVLTIGHLDPRPECSEASNLRRWCQHCHFHCDAVSRAEREHPTPVQREAMARFLRAVGAHA